MSITSFGIFAVLGFLVAGYVLWRNAQEENLSPDQVFDVFLASSIWALVAARVAAILLQFDRFGWDPVRWLSLFHLPGLNGPAALAVGVAMVTIGIARRHWDRWLGLDIFTPAILVWQAALVATWRWSLAGWWIAWAAMLVYVGGKYRLWEWYRGRRSDARPGLVFSLWVVGTGLGFILLALVKVSVLFSSLVGIGLAISGVVLGYRRSGRMIKNDSRDLKKYLSRRFKSKKFK